MAAGVGTGVAVAATVIVAVGAGTVGTGIVGAGAAGAVDVGGGSVGVGGTDVVVGACVGAAVGGGGATVETGAGCSTVREIGVTHAKSSNIREAIAAAKTQTWRRAVLPSKERERRGFSFGRRNCPKGLGSHQ